jgi:hypothetical protein
MLRPQSASDLLVVQAPKAVIFAEPIPVRGLGKPDKKALRAKHAAKAG